MVLTTLSLSTFIVNNVVYIVCVYFRVFVQRYIKSLQNTTD